MKRTLDSYLFDLKNNAGKMIFLSGPPEFRREGEIEGELDGEDSKMGVPFVK